MAEEAHPLENFDINAATEALREAEQNLQKASTDAEKAEAQIAVEAGQAIISAINTGA